MFAVIVACFAEEDVQVLSRSEDVRPDGYEYQYEFSNGVKVEQVGTPALVKGSYKYNAPDGTPIALSYEADENGYRPSGDLIHPVPELIAKALEYIRAHPPPKDTK